MSRNQLQRFCSTMKIFKGKKGKLIAIIHFGEGGQSLLYLPMCTDFLLIGEITGPCSRTLVFSLM